MRLLNADGSPSEVSGNGLRGLGAILAEDAALPVGGTLHVATGAGMKTLTLVSRDAAAGRLVFRADMGPVEDLARRGSTPPARPSTRVTLRVGNPQCVILADRLDEPRLHRIGPALQAHAAFPDAVNVELAHVEAPDRVRILIWERGVGPTESSGTGSCASAVAAAVRRRRRARRRGDRPGRHAARRVGRAEHGLPDRLGGGRAARPLAATDAGMRRLHEAIGAVETYSPAEERFNRRRRTVGLFLAPAVLLLVLLLPLPGLSAAAHRLAAIMADGRRALGHRGAADGGDRAARPGAGGRPPGGAGARRVRARSPIRSSSSSSAASCWPRRCSCTASIGASRSPRCRRGWSARAPTRMLVVYGAWRRCISMWISNTATTAMMFPIGLSIVGARRPARHGVAGRRCRRFAHRHDADDVVRRVDRRHGHAGRHAAEPDRHRHSRAARRPARSASSSGCARRAAGARAVRRCSSAGSRGGARAACASTPAGRRWSRRAGASSGR